MIGYSVKSGGMVRTGRRDILRHDWRNVYQKRIKDVRFALTVSIALHLSIVLVFAVMFSSGPHRLTETVIADLTLVTGPGSAKEGSGQKPAGGQGVKRAAPAPSRKSAPSSQSASPGLAKSNPVAPVTGQSPSLQLDPAGPISTYGVFIGAGREGGHGAGYSEGTGSAGGSGTGGAGGEGGGSGNGPFQGEALQGGSDYYYIRDTVMKNIRYPEGARRMGLEGKVVLSFIVLENGSTREVRVINGSGFKVLDENAKEVVERTVMHKKMPHRVVVTLPITYRLK